MALLFHPAPLERVAIRGHAPPLPRGQKLRVLSWNIQYAASRNQRFFYDGGRAVHAHRADVEHTLDQIARVIRQASPDLVLLQEVDRDSDRTGRVDQHRALLDRVPYPMHSSTPYHKAAWVPHPPHQHMGRVDVHLSVFSRFQLASATRYQLAMLDEPWWRRAFNLKRALFELEMPVEGGGALTVLHTHLSAFSHGDGTLEAQVAALIDRASAATARRSPWLLAGDMNALPPGVDTRDLPPDQAIEYPEATSPLAPLFDRFSSVIPLERYLTRDPTTRTFLPFGAEAPDRTLDYAFTDGLTVSDVAVIDERRISDHLPLVFTVQA
jgi:endonuclease/exonuclease/phosphatase family metal-dependent hydrolase